MIPFAALLDRLAFERSRNAKVAILADYFRRRPDPERGYALAALTGALDFANAKPALVRALVAERTDPVLFAMSYDYVGDLSETAALLWPAPAGDAPPAPGLVEVVETLASLPKRELPRQLVAWLDALDETGRWALLKLITGALRIGVSARLAKTAVAALGGVEPDAIEEVWHGLEPPYPGLFAWVAGEGQRPATADLTPFRAPMLAHPLEDGDLAGLAPADFRAEWKWDGIRVQAVVAAGPEGVRARLYARSGDDIGAAFPDVLDALERTARRSFAIDGELLVLRDGVVQSFATLQQRLNRKSVSAKLAAGSPAHVRAYDLLSEDGEDLRSLPFDERRRRLEALVARDGPSPVDLSPTLPFARWEELAALRRSPPAIPDAPAIEGLMLKRADSPYLPGRPKGPWWKWKRDPHTVDAVMMYAQRGHGKRSSFYSDYTFGVWKGDALVPVGKAYSGFTDAELGRLDRFVRTHTVSRFGPVREVAHGRDKGLVLEIAFEGLQRSARHKSGVAMRFPRVARIRWDKPAAEADRLETLERLLAGAAQARGSPEA